MGISYIHKYIYKRWEKLREYLFKTMCSSTKCVIAWNFVLKKKKTIENRKYQLTLSNTI